MSIKKIHYRYHMNVLKGRETELSFSVPLLQPFITLYLNGLGLILFF